MSRVVVAVEGEVTMRAAHSLASHDGVDEVAVLGPTKSNSFPTVDKPDGWDVVVGRKNAADAGRRSGVVAAVTDDLVAQPGISLGSPFGLVLALAVGVEMVETLAVALPGNPGSGEQIVFPSPIDGRPAVAERHGGHAIQVGRGAEPLTAVMVLGAERHRVVLDDSKFLAGVALAAAAVVATTTRPDRPVPAWSHAGLFLDTATAMGLVLAERAVR